MAAPAIIGAGATVAPVLAAAASGGMSLAKEGMAVAKEAVKAPGKKFPETWPLGVNVPLARALTKDETELLKKALGMDLFRDMTRNPVIQVVALYVIVEALQKLNLLGNVAGNVVEGAGLTAVALNQLSNMSGLAQAVGIGAGMAAGAGYAVTGGGGSEGNGGTTLWDVFKYFTGWISPLW